MREALRSRFIRTDGKARRAAPGNERGKHVGMRERRIDTLLDARISRTGGRAEVIRAKGRETSEIIRDLVQRMCESIGIGSWHGALVKRVIHRGCGQAVVASHENDEGCQRRQRTFEDIAATTHERGLSVEEEGDVGTYAACHGNQALVENIDTGELRVGLECGGRIARTATKATTCRDVLLDFDDERHVRRDSGIPAGLFGSIYRTKDEIVAWVEALDSAVKRDVRARLRGQRTLHDVLFCSHAHDVMQVELLEDGTRLMVAVMRWIGYGQAQVDLGVGFKRQRL